ncbi:MAG: glutamyl-tRNA reductase [Candidatus Omnitrophica bacterium CG1_02_46_14]|nr:MAG: glutamyl-tRNA reductase [Candidatus Omnitrophica bacterium CG1_02_46_14]
MDILVLGLNHKTAPIEIRERLSIPKSKGSELLKALETRQIFEERLLLSTCNRTEIYGVGLDLDESINKAKAFLSEYSKLDLSKFENNLYVMKQPDSVKHLFSVTAGLDSMVLGETEIIGQVKEAYLEAHKNQQTGKVLNNLFQRSFKVAKNVRTNTNIGIGRVSIASVAVDLAEKIFEDLKNLRIMVLGTGAMSTAVTKAMVSKGALPMIVSSHHPERAEAIAKEWGGEALPHDTYHQRIAETDILIAATSCQQAVITELKVKDWMRARREKPFFLIDIGVPRNIETSIEKLDDVYLYNIDDLQNIANKNMASRQNQLDQCFHLIQGQTHYFMDWLFKEFGSKALPS